MPVTIQVAQHGARAVPDSLLTGTAKAASDISSLGVLQKLAHKNVDEIGPILQTAIGPQTSLPDDKLHGLRFSVQDHGLVRAAYHAYSSHHHLVLRPEDIWFAVLTQFSFFVNAHAEELRSSFVAHDGKKGLILRDPEQPDMGLMCRNMTKLIDENIVDPQLRAWILPSFTTTTRDDEVVASVIMMGTLQRYFDYVFDCTACGIPTVTLLGEKSDWEDIEQRIEKLTEYGDEPTLFCELLRPILRNMVNSFTAAPGDATIVDFWSRIIDRQWGSGMDTLTGWMVAFCLWDEEGTCQNSGRPGLLPKTSNDGRSLDDVRYHTVEFNEVPAGFVSAPVTYMYTNDNGVDVVVMTKLLAGFVGFETTKAVDSPPRDDLSTTGSLSGTSSSASTSRSTTAERRSHHVDKNSFNTLQPLTGWWMYEIKDAEDTGKSKDYFLQDRMANSWNGQASTGYVSQEGSSVVVKDGLPRI